LEEVIPKYRANPGWQTEEAQGYEKEALGLSYTVPRRDS
jgi:hypothetical protein